MLNAFADFLMIVLLNAYMKVDLKFRPPKSTELHMWYERSEI